MKKSDIIWISIFFLIGIIILWNEIISLRLLTILGLLYIIIDNIKSIKKRTMVIKNE